MTSPSSHVIHTDVVVIGSGIAALHFVRTLGGARRVHLLTKTRLRESNSYRAQGGVAAVIDAAIDSFEHHRQDTLAAGAYHHDQAAVAVLVEDGADEVQNLIAEGFAVDADINGIPERALEGAHSYPRVIHAGGDATGERLIEFSLAHLPDSLSIYEGHTVFELLLHEGQCVGVRSRTEDGTVYDIYAPFTVLASGGAGQVYRYTTAAPTVTGDGLALAYLAGAKLADMEFVQFHPTLLYVDGKVCGLLTEAIRGDGGVLVNRHGTRIMAAYPLGDLSPRYLTAHQIFTTCAQGEKVLLDIRTITDFAQRFPTAAALCRQYGVSLDEGLLPVMPGCHFLMGGVMSDLFGQSSLPGLSVIGEVAYTGVHGANRLASNSLLEGLVFARRLAVRIRNTDLPTTALPTVPRLPERPLPEMLLTDTLQDVMMRDVGIVRNMEGLRRASTLLPDPRCLSVQDLSRFQRVEIERYLMNVTAALIVGTALERPESRGAHILSDYPHTDPTWGNRRLVWYNRTLVTEEF